MGQKATATTERKAWSISSESKRWYQRRNGIAMACRASTHVHANILVGSHRGRPTIFPVQPPHGSTSSIVTHSHRMWPLDQRCYTVSSRSRDTTTNNLTAADKQTSLTLLVAGPNPSPVCLIRDYCVDFQRLGHLTLVEGGEWAKYYLLTPIFRSKGLGQPRSLPQHRKPRRMIIGALCLLAWQPKTYLHPRDSPKHRV